MRAKAAMQRTAAKLRAAAAPASSLSDGEDFIGEIILEDGISDDRWLTMASWFAMKPHQETLPRMVEADLCDGTTQWDRGYHMLKPKPFSSIELAAKIFSIPDRGYNGRGMC
jgi:hypothetical protein